MCLSAETSATFHKSEGSPMVTRSTGSRSACSSVTPQDISPAEYAEVRLHRLLDQRANLTGLVAALAIADLVEALQRAVLGVPVHLTHVRSWLDELRRAQVRW
jgi:hypothetical protein